jgi:hypothetical protein
MAKHEPEVTPPGLADFLGSIKDIAEESRASRALRQLTVAEVKNDTPWNPEGLPKIKLKCERFYMCGAPVKEDMLSNDEIAAINKLKPGRYNKRKWEVLKFQDKSIDIRYPRVTVADRFDLKGDAPSLLAMLTKINDEYADKLAKKKAGIFEEEEE